MTPKAKLNAILIAFLAASATLIGAKFTEALSGGPINFKDVFVGGLMAGVVAALKYLLPASFLAGLPALGKSIAMGVGAHYDTGTLNRRMRAKKAAFAWSSVLSSGLVYAAQALSQGAITKGNLISMAISSVLGGLVGGTAYVQPPPKLKDI